MRGGADVQLSQSWRVGGQLEAAVSDFNCPFDEVLAVGCDNNAGALTRRRDSGFLYQGTALAYGTLDLRDDPFRPSRGALLSTTADINGGGGKLRDDRGGEDPVVSNFVKVQGTATGYLPLGPDIVWAVSLRGGNIFPLGGASPGGVQNYIPLFKRFYLGGTNTVRGFNEDEILPADPVTVPVTRDLQRAVLCGIEDPLNEDCQNADTRVTSQGGNFFLNARSELRIGLTKSLELGLFIDVGELLEDVRNITPNGIAVGVGWGVRFLTPVGPLAIDIGSQVVDGRRDLPAVVTSTPPWITQRANLHLSIGYF